MNSYKRIYELLLEEAFLLEQRKPLTWKKKLGAGVLGAAALFGAGKGMQGTSTAKASPAPITFETDYDRGGGVRRTTKPKNPFGKVPRWAHRDDKGKASSIPRDTRYGASLDWQADQPNRERQARRITGKGFPDRAGYKYIMRDVRGPDPDMPKRGSGEIGPISKPSDAAERVIDQMANQRSTRRLQKLVDRSNKIVRKAKKAAAETPWIGGPGDPASEPTEDEWYDIISKNKGETDITAISRRIPGQVLSRTGKMYDKAGGKELGKRSRLEKDSPGFEERRKKARREVFRSADLRASRRFYKEQELQKEKEQELQKENAYNRIYDLSLEIRKKPGEMI